MEAMKGCAPAVLLVALILGGPGCKPSSTGESSANTISLSNGLRIVTLQMPGSTNVAIFTFLPMGLTHDGPKQAQWSHLVEHLVIRSTVPADSMQANAETLPDHMRLDFYGSLNNWRDGLKHHADWLAGVPFTQENLVAEKPKVMAECDFTTKNFATHKFALAAWNQGFRHGQSHAAVKGDVLRATLREMQNHRNEHLVVLDKAVVCVVGGIERDKLMPAVAERLAALKSSATPPGPVKVPRGSRDLTWDLDARHLVLTWSIPAMESEDYPALLVAGHWLMMQFYSDPDLKKRCGMVLAGADLTTPEGNFFYVSASLRPETSFKEVRDRIEPHVQALRAGGGKLSTTAMLGKQLAESLAKVPDPASLKGQLPPGTSLAMVEMNLGLQWGMNEFRYGPRKTALAQKLSAVNAKTISTAAHSHLSVEKMAVLTLRRAGTEVDDRR